MRVTLFIYNLGGGGAERVACNLANYLVSPGHNVSLLTVEEENAGYHLDAKVTHTALSKKEERKGAFSDYAMWLKRLYKYITASETDCYVAMLLIPIRLLMLLRRAVRVPIIISERNAPSMYPLRIRMMLMILAGRADGYVFQTTGAKEWYAPIRKNRPWAVIPNAVHERFLNPAPEGNKRKKQIVSVGRLEKQKNFELLIRAFSIVSEKFTDYTLMIYGQGSQRNKLEQLSVNLGLSDKVIFPGFARDIEEKIRESAIFVMSSDFEGMPNALAEALAAGLPCISTDCPCGGPEFLIDSGRNGILVPVGDTRALSEAMLRLLSDEELAKRLGREAFQIRKDLAPHVIYGKWEAFLKEMVLHFRERREWDDRKKIQVQPDDYDSQKAPVKDGN